MISQLKKGGKNTPNIVLTKSTMPIVKWVAEILGLLMNGIFNVIESIGIPNVVEGKKMVS